MKEIEYMPVGRMKPSYRTKAKYWHDIARLAINYMIKLGIVAFGIGFMAGALIF